MKCAERERLWLAYNNAIDEFTECAEDLEKAVGSVTLSAVLIALRGAKDACVHAREAWQEHLRTHECDQLHRKRASPTLLSFDSRVR
jgi:hypothetical protein